MTSSYEKNMKPYVKCKGLTPFFPLVENCGMKQTEAADYFGVSFHAVSKGIKRIKSLARNDKTIKKLMKEMSNVEV